jgi:hypothetical protein
MAIFTRFLHYVRILVLTLTLTRTRKSNTYFIFILYRRAGCCLVSFDGELGIRQLLNRYGCPHEFDFITIDVDGNDYHLWEAMTTLSSSSSICSSDSGINSNSRNNSSNSNRNISKNSKNSKHILSHCDTFDSSNSSSSCDSNINSTKNTASIIDGNGGAIGPYRARVVCIEFNPSIPNDVIFVQDRNIHVQQGSSLRALQELGIKLEYTLVCVTTFNAFFVCNKYVHLLPMEAISSNVYDLRPASSMITSMYQTYDGKILLDFYYYYYYYLLNTNYYHLVNKIILIRLHACICMIYILTDLILI